MTAAKKHTTPKSIPAKGGYSYDYSEETLRKYMRTSTAWKLNWLEEANRITNAALTKKEKIIRDKIRRGEL